MPRRRLRERPTASSADGCRRLALCLHALNARLATSLFALWPISAAGWFQLDRLTGREMVHCDEWCITVTGDGS